MKFTRIDTMSFPRGGAKTNSDSKAKSSGFPKSDPDALFGSKKRLMRIEDRSGDKKKARADALQTVGLAAAVGAGMTKELTGSNTLKVEAISFNKYQTGSLVMGYVMQVYDSKATISLPGGAVGSVNIEEVSDATYRLMEAYNAEFSSKKQAALLSGKRFNAAAEISAPKPDMYALLVPMQAVRVFVLGQEQREGAKRKTLNLSMRSSYINRQLQSKHLVHGYPLSGCVVSREDHGYIISAGISGVNLFLPIKAVPAALGELVVGQPVETLVEDVNTAAKTITLRAHRKAVCTAIVRSSSLPFTACIPGMLVDVIVEKILPNGLLVKFWDLFMGVIDELSLAAPDAAKRWHARYPVGSVLLARVVYANHGNKAIRLSLRPHVLELRGPTGLPPLGSVLENFTVATVMKRTGVLLAAATDEDEADHSGDERQDDGAPNKKKEAKKDAEIARRQREVDSRRIGAFVHKNSLSARGPDSDEDSSSDEGEEEGEMLRSDDDEPADDVEQQSGSDAEADSAVDSESDNDNVSEPDVTAYSTSELGKTKKSNSTAALDLEKDESLGGDPDKVEKLYKCGNAIHQVRVMGYNLVEGWIFGSNLQHHTLGGLVHPSSVILGAKYVVRVVAIDSFGLVVRLGDRVKAVCPLLHTSDVPTTSTSLSKRFKIGQKIVVRVWELKGSQVLVTHKKSLVEEEEEPLLSADEMRTGMICQGVVSHVDTTKGAIVHFYNRIRAFLPIQVLVKQGVNDPVEALRVGQTLKVMIIRKAVVSNANVKGKKSAEMRRVRLTAALDVGKRETVLQLAKEIPADNALEEVMQNDETGEPIGDEVNKITNAAEKSSDGSESAAGHGTHIPLERANGVITGSEDKKLTVRLSDGRLGVLPWEQCFDFAKTTDSIFQMQNHSFQKGKALENMLVVGFDRKQNLVHLSLKPLLLQVCDTLNTNSESLIFPSKVADMVPGQIVAGTVLKVEEFGVLVRFGNGMAALCPRPSIADSFVKTPVGLFTQGDSVRCAVQRVDLTRERAILSMKSSLVKPSSGKSTYLGSFLREQALVASYNANPTFTASWKDLFPGKVVEAVVSTLEDYGTVLLHEDGVTMLLAQAPHHNVTHITTIDKKGKEKKQNLVENMRVRAMVLDFDFVNGVIQVSMDPKLLTASATTTKKGSRETNMTPFAAGATVEARVELVKEHYLVVSSGSDIGYVSIADYHRPTKSAASFQVHDNLQVGVLKIASDKKFVDELYKGVLNPYAAVALLTVHDTKLSAGAMSTKPEMTAALKEKFEASLRLESILRWRIISISPTLITVEPAISSGAALPSGVSVLGSVHVSNAIDHVSSQDEIEQSLNLRDDDNLAARAAIGTGHPFHGLSNGDAILGRVLQIKHDKAQNKKTVLLQLLPRKEKHISDEGDNSNTLPVCPLFNWRGNGKSAIQVNALYAACIVRVEDTYCVVAISPYITIKISYTDITSNFQLAKKFASGCYVGQRLVVGTIKVDISDHPSKETPNVVLASRRRVETLSSTALTLDSAEARDFPALLEAKALAQANSKAKKSKKVASVTDATGEAPKFTAQVGDVTMGIIDLKSTRKEANHNAYVRVNLPDGQSGRVDITELADSGEWVDLTWLSRAVRDDEGFASKSSKNSKQKGSNVGTVGVLPGGLKHGELCQCRVLEAGKGPLALSLRPTRINATTVTAACAPDALPEEGAKVLAYVSNTSAKGCFVRLSRTLTGQVEIRNLSDDFVDKPEESFPTGKLVQARVLSLSLERNSAKLSMKSTAVSGTDPVRDAQFAKLVEGQIVRGKVQSIDNKHGVFVAIDDTTLVGLARRPQCTNQDTADLKDMFNVGDIVRAKVLALAQTSKKISLGLKPSYFKDASDDSESGSDSDASENSEVTGNSDDESDVDESEDDSDADSEIDGNVRMLEAGESDDESMDALVKNASLKEQSDSDDSPSQSGDDNDDDEEVQAMIIDESDSDNDSVEELIKKAALRDAESESDADDGDEEVPSAKKTSKDGGKQADNGKKRKAVEQSSESSEESSDEENIQELFHKPKARKTDDFDGLWDDFKPAALQPTTATASKAPVSDSDDDDNDDSEDENKKQSRSQKQRQKELEKRQQEQQVRSLENKYAQENFAPKTTQDFERLLLGEPNSSYLWIQYMAHHLTLADIDSARSVAERAIKSINFRLEEEKYNVWVAFLNLEHDYGDNNSLNNIFKRAIQESKGKYLHLNLADVFEKGKDLKGAEAILEKALKKYKYSKKVWMAYQHFCLRNNFTDHAKSLLSRSLQSLSRHKHIEVLTKYALAEFDIGDINRGRVVFEELISSYPKRTDLLHVYVDKEIKLGYYPQARQLFERMCASKLNVHKMKTVFKKFLEFEKKFGTAESAEAVLQKAKAYAASIH